MSPVESNLGRKETLIQAEAQTGWKDLRAELQLARMPKKRNSQVRVTILFVNFLGPTTAPGRNKQKEEPKKREFKSPRKIIWNEV